MFRSVLSLALVLLAIGAMTSCKKEDSEGGGLFAPKTQVVRIGVIADVGAAPILIAQKQGLFEKQNLGVTVSTHASTEEIRNQLASGQLDLGMTTPAEALLPESDLIVPHILARNGGSVSVSEELWKLMEPQVLLDASGKPVQPVAADSLAPVAQSIGQGNAPVTFSVASLHDTSTYTLCYWLGAADITPIMTGSQAEPPHPHLGGASVAISTAPATTNLMQGLAGNATQGRQVIANSAIVRDLPSSVLASSKNWAEANRETLVKVVASLIKAGQWLDGSIENRRQAATDIASVVPSFAQDAPHMVSFGQNASAAPDPNHPLWLATQMMRWGQLPGSLTDAELQASVMKVFRSDIFKEAAATLSTPLQGLDSRLEEQSIAHLIDGNVFLPQRPSAYARSFEIGLR